MTSLFDRGAVSDSDLYALKGKDLENFGFSRVRDAAYDAVQELWRRRKAEGWTQVMLAQNLDRDTGWLSKYLRGPGNWTFRTFGALVQGLDGQVEIRVRAAEDELTDQRNYSPYSEYVLDIRPPVTSTIPARIDIFESASRSPKVRTVASSSLYEPA